MVARFTVFIFGFISVIIVGITKLYNMYNGMPYRLVTDSPILLLVADRHDHRNSTVPCRLPWRTDFA